MNKIPVKRTYNAKLNKIQITIKTILNDITPKIPLAIIVHRVINHSIPGM